MAPDLRLRHYPSPLWIVENTHLPEDVSVDGTVQQENEPSPQVLENLAGRPPTPPLDVADIMETESDGLSRAELVPHEPDAMEGVSMEGREILLGIQPAPSISGPTANPESWIGPPPGVESDDEQSLFPDNDPLPPYHPPETITGDTETQVMRKGVEEEVFRTAHVPSDSFPPAEADPDAVVSLTTEERMEAFHVIEESAQPKVKDWKVVRKI